jgi:hypothetical protein
MSNQRKAIAWSAVCFGAVLSLAACRSESKQSAPAQAPAETVAAEPAHEARPADPAPAPADNSGVTLAGQADSGGKTQADSAGKTQPDSAAKVQADAAPQGSSADAKTTQIQKHIANAEAFLASSNLEKAQAEADAALELDARNVRAAELRAQILSKKSSGAAVVARPPTEGAVSTAPKSTPPPPRKSTPSPRTGEFGEPLIVNGREVSENDIRRFLIYGPCRGMLDLHRLDLIIDDEIVRRAQQAGDAAIEPQVAARAGKEAEAAIAGKTFASDEEKQKAYDQALNTARMRARNSPDLLKPWQEATAAEQARLEESLRPTEAEFQSEFHKAIDDFKQNYPVLDVEAEVGRKFRTVEWFKMNLRRTMYFDKVFYPEDPNDWPETTVAAVMADSGPEWIEDAKKSYEVRRAHADKTGEPLPKEDSFYTQVMQQIVTDALYSTIDFKTMFDGLPDDIVLTADKNGDGKPEMTLMTADIWAKVKDTVTEEEIRGAKQWFVTSMATEDRLREEGALLGEVDCNAALAEYQKQFVGTYITLDILAMLTYYFPSTETFKQHYCMSEGFKKLMEPKLADSPAGDVAQPLRDYLDKGNRILGLGQVDLEAMLIAAFDIPKNKWKKDGWRWAEQKAKDVKAQIDANAAAWEAQKAEEAKVRAEGKEFKPENPVEEPYKFWTRMMDEHSEFWDPPPPEKGRASQIGMHNRGRLGERYRNDLQGYLSETFYTHWVTGRSLTDTAFFDVPEGVVKGPFKGPQGYYLLRVNKRKPPTYPLNLSEPKKVQLLKDDYLRQAFVEYSREAVEKADIKGFQIDP